METTIVYWGNIGIMENEMETTIMGPTPVVPFFLFWDLVMQAEH